MDRLEEMRTFVQVADAAGITGAAERLGIAKSAVSRRITELEARLRAQLFQRSTRRFSLTDAGRHFYEVCRRILDEVDEAEAMAGRVHRQLEGPLRVAAPLSFGLLHLMPALAAFMEAHPGLDFDLDFNDRQVDLLRDGFDMAIRIGDLPDSTLVARRLAPVRSVLCAAPSLLARMGPPASPESLTDYPCLIYTNSPDAGRWHCRDAAGRERTVEVGIRARANSGDALKALAVAAAGIALLPSFLLRDALDTGSLEAVLPEYHWPVVHAHALYPQARHVSQRVRALIDFLAARFADQPYWDCPRAAPPGIPAGPRTAAPAAPPAP